MESPRRILMLVPHEPELDPRIRWVTQLCAEFGPTDIIASVSSIEMLKSVGRPAQEYNGNIYLERITKMRIPPRLRNVSAYSLALHI